MKNKRFGQFSVLTCLQHSPLASTYVAADRDGQYVLLRSVAQHTIDRETDLDIASEVASLSEINIPEYNQPIQWGCQDGETYVAYRWLEGRPLSKLMRSSAWPQEASDRTDLVLAVAHSVLTALDRIHSEGFPHRDIRPSHTIVTSDHRIVLSGYGPLCIGAAFESSRYQAREFDTFALAAAAGGSWQEQIRADLNSLGIMFRTMIEPQSADESRDYLQPASMRPLPASEGGQYVAQPVAEFIERLTSDDPDQQYRRNPAADRD